MISKIELAKRIEEVIANWKDYPRMTRQEALFRLHKIIEKVRKDHERRESLERRKDS